MNPAAVCSTQRQNCGHQNATRPPVKVWSFQWLRVTVVGRGAHSPAPKWPPHVERGERVYCFLCMTNPLRKLDSYYWRSVMSVPTKTSPLFYEEDALLHFVQLCCQQIKEKMATSFPYITLHTTQTCPLEHSSTLRLLQTGHVIDSKLKTLCGCNGVFTYRVCWKKKGKGRKKLVLPIKVQFQ